MNNSNQNLYNLLREKRNQIAREEGVKPFMVLHNKVLQEIAQSQSRTVNELGRIKGMGQKRLSKYGESILEVVNEYSLGQVPGTVEKIFSVGEFIDFLNRVALSQRATVQGEIGEVDNRENYTFFKLLDENEEAVLNCFIWRDKLEGLGIELKEGLELKVEGYPKIFKKRGSFTFEVEHIGLVGEGALRIAFEKLKKKLNSEGYFAPERKKPVPEYVANIGLITSNFGDARQDFLTHLGKFGFKIFFYDVRVEGFYAVEDIASALKWFNESRLCLDVLVLTRGGGSLESLSAFNSEGVAKSIFASKIPVLTGIGHENDTTIADLVADIRASTPTDAARILSDPWRSAINLLANTQGNIISIFSTAVFDFKKSVLDFEKGIINVSNQLLNFRRQKLNNLQMMIELHFKNFLREVKQKQIDFLNNWRRLKMEFATVKSEVGDRQELLTREFNRWLKGLTGHLTVLEQGIYLGSPEKRLKQGYSIIFDIGSKIVKSSKQIKVGDILKLKFYDGSAASKVEKLDS